MPEGELTHIVEALNRKRETEREHQFRFEFIEIIEALLLALVAVSTSWSGYQAAKWDTLRAQLYSKANRLTVDAEDLATQAGQERIYDNETFDCWLRAKFDKKDELARFYEHRFRDEYRRAFSAWLEVEPFKNDQSPPGPLFMPQYHNAKRDQAIALRSQAADFAKQGTKSGETGDQYVRITVILATVLLITAIGQRFRAKGVRTMFMALASLLLCIPLANLFLLPRI
ncbi:MAG TPA: hypothetical protein VF753_03280 [Terriglobales bacterium]